MRISNNFASFELKNYTLASRKETTKPKQLLKSKHFELPKYSNFIYPVEISFTGIKEKRKELKELDLDDEIVEILARLKDEKYDKAETLLSLGVNPIVIPNIVKLNGNEFKNVLTLIKKDIYDEELIELSMLDEKEFKQGLELIDKGIQADLVSLFISLSESEFKEAEKLLKQGIPQSIAPYYAKLTEEQRETANKILQNTSDIDIESSYIIAKLDKEHQEKCFNLLSNGLSIEFVLDFMDIGEEEDERLNQLLTMKVSQESLKSLISLDKDNYQKALALLKEGVNSTYLPEILELETGEKESEEYTDYKKKGYGKTAAFSISLLSNKEFEALGRIIKKHPEIKELLKGENEVKVIKLESLDEYESIITQEFRPQENSLITLVRTFNEFGDKTYSRTEEKENKTKTSIIKNGQYSFKVKYDQYGEIKELTEYVLDEDKSVKEVIHSMASDKLLGAFDSTFYDISQFKTGTNEEDIDKDIEDSVISEGEPISTVEVNSDGSITYKESIQINEFLTDRTYTEKRDSSGKKVYTQYSYRIRKEDSDTPEIDINRSYKKNPDGSVDNNINGINYHITFDDENKIIHITDGEKEKTINANEKMAYYSKEAIWSSIKELPADIIIDIFNNIKSWKYCLNEESFVLSSNENILSTGNNESIIAHETGHLRSERLLEDDDFLNTYLNEMNNFQMTIPYNEQSFVEYFSPRSKLCDSEGADEFIAESNILLTKYGTNIDGLKTRSQFLVKYFPETIIKVAKYLGKDSKESILQ